MKCHSWAIKVSNNNHRAHRLLNITREDNTDHLKRFLRLGNWGINHQCCPNQMNTKA